MVVSLSPNRLKTTSPYRGRRTRERRERRGMGGGGGGRTGVELEICLASSSDFISSTLALTYGKKLVSRG